MTNPLSASKILSNISIENYTEIADAANAEILLKLLKSDQTSINTAYTTAIAKITDLKTLMELCKLFAAKLDPLDPLDSKINFTNNNSKKTLLNYFSKFIIKKRATYLYLYTALMLQNKKLKEKIDALTKATTECTTSTQQLKEIKDKIKAVLKPLNTNTTIESQIESIFNANANANAAQAVLTKKITDINEELKFLRKFTTDSMDLAIKWNEVGDVQI